MGIQFFNDTTDYLSLGTDFWATNLKGGSVQLYDSELKLLGYDGTNQNGGGISISPNLNRIEFKANNPPSGIYDVVFKNSTLLKIESPTGTNKITLTPTTLSANRSQSFQDANGVVALTSDILNLGSSDLTSTSNERSFTLNGDTAVSKLSTRNASLVPLMTVFGDGNVAIGASSAGARLDVHAQGALATDIAFKSAMARI